MKLKFFGVTNLVIFLFMLIPSYNYAVMLYEGSNCRTHDGKDGTCKLLSNCLKLFLAIHRGDVRPGAYERCSFLRTEEVVCCENEISYDPLDFLKIDPAEEIGKAFDRAFKVAESIKPSSSFYPLGPISDEQRAILRYRPCSSTQQEPDPTTCGPKPISINKYLNKINKSKQLTETKAVESPIKKKRGGKRQQIKKLINIAKELLNICSSEEEIIKYNKLLNINKSKLNKMKKTKNNKD